MHAIDADLAGDLLRNRKVVTGEQHGLEPELLQLGDCLGAGRLHGVCDRDDSAHVTVPGDEHDGLARGLEALLRFSRLGTRRDGPVAHERIGADQHWQAVGDAADALARSVLKRLDRGEALAAVRAQLIDHAPRDGLRDRVL